MISGTHRRALLRKFQSKIEMLLASSDFLKGGGRG
jgi:hypothetical protein